MLRPYTSADIHIKVNPDLSLSEAHKISVEVEKKIIKQVELVNQVNVHICLTSEEGICLD